MNTTATLTWSFNIHLAERPWREKHFAFIRFFGLEKDIVEGMLKTFQS